MSPLESYLEGLTAGLRSAIGDMLHRRASADDRDRVAGIIDCFAADLAAAAREIAARNTRRRPKVAAAARGPYLRLIVDNTSRTGEART